MAKRVWEMVGKRVGRIGLPELMDLFRDCYGKQTMNRFTEWQLRVCHLKRKGVKDPYDGNKEPLVSDVHESLWLVDV